MMILNKVILPMPPTINKYYCRARSGGVYCDESVVEFRRLVTFSLRDHKKDSLDRLALAAGFSFSTKRENDVDNRVKGLQDALQFAKIFKNDSQIDFLCAWRMPKSASPGGNCMVWLGTIPDDMFDVFTIASKWSSWGS